MDTANHANTLATSTSADRWAPFPPNGKRCPFTGLSHARAYALILKGPARRHVRTVSLAEPGKRGTRLFHVGDALRYFENLAATQAAAGESADS